MGKYDHLRGIIPDEVIDAREKEEKRENQHMHMLKVDAQNRLRNFFESLTDEQITTFAQMLNEMCCSPHMTHMYLGICNADLIIRRGLCTCGNNHNEPDLSEPESENKTYKVAGFDADGNFLWESTMINGAIETIVGSGFYVPRAHKVVREDGLVLMDRGKQHGQG